MEKVGKEFSHALVNGEILNIFVICKTQVSAHVDKNNVHLWPMSKGQMAPVISEG